MKTKKKYFIFYLLLGFCFLCVLGLLVFLKVPRNNTKAYLPIAAHALEHLFLDQTKPVNEEILAFNPLRQETGLSEVKKDWKIVAIGMEVADGPRITVLLDVNGAPAKVIEDYSFARGSSNNVVTEYEVSNGKLNGLSATWLGNPQKVFINKTFEDNKLNGPIIYYSETGQEICRCEFKANKPWTGRVLDRRDFDQIWWDISYKDGKLHGQEKQFWYGQIQHVRTFKNGILDGIQQQYQDGILSSERILENGVCRSFKGWYLNGQLHEEDYYSASGKLNGTRRMWDANGNLTVEQNYLNGKEHGRFWDAEHPDIVGWYINGKGAFSD